MTTRTQHILTELSIMTSAWKQDEKVQVYNKATASLKVNKKLIELEERSDEKIDVRYNGDFAVTLSTKLPFYNQLQIIKTILEEA